MGDGESDQNADFLPGDLGWMKVQAADDATAGTSSTGSPVSPSVMWPIVVIRTCRTNRNSGSQIMDKLCYVRLMGDMDEFRVPQTSLIRYRMCTDADVTAPTDLDILKRWKNAIELARQRSRICLPLGQYEFHANVASRGKLTPLQMQRLVCSDREPHFRGIIRGDEMLTRGSWVVIDCSEDQPRAERELQVDVLRLGNIGRDIHQDSLFVNGDLVVIKRITLDNGDIHHVVHFLNKPSEEFTVDFEDGSIRGRFYDPFDAAIKSSAPDIPLQYKDRGSQSAVMIFGESTLNIIETEISGLFKGDG
ncbi:hypothetical protein HDU93_008628, partial [Gonapodya sp. JEL0774]